MHLFEGLKNMHKSTKNIIINIKHNRKFSVLLFQLREIEYLCMVEN